jgi:hypothetical protein
MANRGRLLLEQTDVERIARAALKELGAASAEVTVSPDAQRPGHWRIEIQQKHGGGCLRIACGDGTTPEWVRTQIFEKFLAQS